MRKSILLIMILSTKCLAWHPIDDLKSSINNRNAQLDAESRAVRLENRISLKCEPFDYKCRDREESRAAKRLSKDRSYNSKVL